MPQGRGKRNKDAASSKMEQYKQFCPPNKQKDLDALVKAMSGNEDKIMARIQEWWDEPQPSQEAEWEDVNKKGTSKKQPKQSQPRHPKQQHPSQQQKQQHQTTNGGRGRGGRARGSGGRGGRASSERRGRGGGHRSPPVEKKTPTPIENDSAAANSTKVEDEGVPKPVTVAPAPRGAWGQAAAAPPPQTPKVEAPFIDPLPPPLEKPMDIGIVATSDPTPSGLKETVVVDKPVRSSGNVWATKGSAHLIQAEKPKPPPPPQSRPSPKRMELPVQETRASMISSPPALPPTSSIGGAPTWDTTPLSPTVPVPPSPKAAPAPAPKPAPVLNMGHWESGEGDDTQNLDFGFGSFGNESEGPVDRATPSKDASTMSPARPPPGLSIGGMPPMPANAVLVHELENASLGQSAETPASSAPKTDLPTSHPVPPTQHPPLGAPPGGMPQPPNYNAGYAMGVGYSYNAPGGNGFVGVPGALPGAPPPSKAPAGLAGGPATGVVVSGPQGPQGGLYGASNSNNEGSNVPLSSEGTATTNATAAAIPPGMPGAAMPYNPPVFYGQQPYQMGQPHGGVGYGYGYGAQFGGGAAFGYQQGMMGQNGGYGGHYDDQQQQQQQRSDGGGGYQNKHNGGYRGRNSNQYAQNQYTPGGYGGQPYGMGGYDHFGGPPQRSGYGPGNMDPYSMQQQQQGGGGGGANYHAGGIHAFQDDEHNRGGGNRKGDRNGGLPPQQSYQQGQQQPPFGLQGGGGNPSSGSNTNNGRGGWSNQGGGGWGGGPSWQHGN